MTDGLRRLRVGAAIAVASLLALGAFASTASAAPLSMTFTEARANVGKQLKVEEDVLFSAPATAPLEAQIDPVTGQITAGNLTVPAFSTHIEEPISSDVTVEFDIGVIYGTFNAATGELSLTGTAAGVLTYEDGKCNVSAGTLILSTSGNTGGDDPRQGSPFTNGLAGNGAIAGTWSDMEATPHGSDPGDCVSVDSEIGGPGGIWLERKDSEAPAAPQLTGTDPASPGLSGTPRIKGIAEAGSTVAIFESSTCMGSPVATGSAEELNSPGLVVNVPEEVTRKFSAKATDSAGNVSDCSAPISYTHQKAKIDPKPVVKPTPDRTACAKAKTQRNKANRKVKQARKKVVQLRNKARAAKSKKRSANLRKAGKRWQTQLKRRKATQRRLKAKANRTCRS